MDKTEVKQIYEGYSYRVELHSYRLQQRDRQSDILIGAEWVMGVDNGSY